MYLSTHILGGRYVFRRPALMERLHSHSELQGPARDLGSLLARTRVYIQRPWHSEFGYRANCRNCQND
jgi:hypothetical protein